MSHALIAYYHPVFTWGGLAMLIVIVSIVRFWSRRPGDRR